MSAQVSAQVSAHMSAQVSTQLSAQVSAQAASKADYSRPRQTIADQGKLKQTKAKAFWYPRCYQHLRCLYYHICYHTLPWAQGKEFCTVVIIFLVKILFSSPSVVPFIGCEYRSQTGFSLGHCKKLMMMVMTTKMVMMMMIKTVLMVKVIKTVMDDNDNDDDDEDNVDLRSAQGLEMKLSWGVARTSSVWKHSSLQSWWIWLRYLNNYSAWTNYTNGNDEVKKTIQIRSKSQAARVYKHSSLQSWWICSLSE